MKWEYSFADGESGIEGIYDMDVSEFLTGEKQYLYIVASNGVQGWFVGSITQNPYRIGYLAVELAYKAANGEAVSDVDTGAQWYTAENIDKPEIALLVYD